MIFWVTSDLAIAYKCLWKIFSLEWLLSSMFFDLNFWINFHENSIMSESWQNIYFEKSLCANKTFVFWSDLIFEWLWAKHSIMSDFWQNYYFEQLSIKHSLWSDSWLRITIWISSWIIYQAFDLYLSDISTILSKSS